MPDVLNNRTHVKSTKGRVLLYPEIKPPCYIYLKELFGEDIWHTCSLIQTKKVKIYGIHVH